MTPRRTQDSFFFSVIRPENISSAVLFFSSLRFGGWLTTEGENSQARYLLYRNFLFRGYVTKASVEFHASRYVPVPFCWNQSDVPCYYWWYQGIFYNGSGITVADKNLKGRSKFRVWTKVEWRLDWKRESLIKEEEDRNLKHSKSSFFDILGRIAGHMSQTWT